MTIVITEELATKVLSIVDAGLVSGVGDPVPGQMCVEAAVCFALGLPHGDDPQCVSPALRSLKIRLNDIAWPSKGARAKGLRRLAVAQLGSKDVLDDVDFVGRVSKMTITKYVPLALRAAALVQRDEKHRAALEAAAVRCEIEGSKEAAHAAYVAASAAHAAHVAASASYAAHVAASYAVASVAHAAVASAAYAARAVASASYAASYAAKRNSVLSEFAEDVVQILVAMGAPGCQWLVLTE